MSTCGREEVELNRKSDFTRKMFRPYCRTVGFIELFFLYERRRLLTGYIELRFFKILFQMMV